MKIKALKEKRNLLLNDLETMVSGLESEGEIRALTEEEKTSFKEKESEIRSIDETIALVEETRAKAVGESGVKELAEKRSGDAIEKRAFEDFLRGKDLNAEQRTLLTSTASNTATIPVTINPTVMQKLYEMCPILAKARRFNSKGTLRLLKEDSLGSAEVTGENQAFTEEDVLFGSVQLQAFKVTSVVSATFEMLANSDIDLSNYLLDVIVRRLSRKINKLCLVGTGVGQAEGIVNCDNIQAIGNALTISDMIKMQTAINPEYLNGSMWVCNRKTFQEMGAMLDNTGRPYLVANVINESVAYTMLGLPVVVDENMADLGQGAKAIMLANIGEAYAINMLEDITVKVLQEVGFLQGVQQYAGLCMFDGRIINRDAMIVGVCGAVAPKTPSK